jgi:N-acetyldiaminopimelate deacetylase
MGGAESILSEKQIQAFDIKAALALHVSGNLPLSTVSSKAGIFFAIPQEFDVEFTGKAAHAAFPDKGKNALQGGVEFLNRINPLISNLQKKAQVIFNIGVMSSGKIRNIIPDKCLLQGTHRTLNKVMRDKINAKIRQIAGKVAAELGLKSKVSLLCTYDPVVNDAWLYGELDNACRNLGVKFKESGTFMTGEDFGFFTSIYPGLLFWLGAGKQPHDLHSDKFLPDADCLGTGVDIFFQLLKQIS